ncbi:hypothetical protein O181_124645, partial [Austropuccinia psidii MF-1]|nr:hypothetical protein [Austropuccinia psidii MF-1]
TILQDIGFWANKEDQSTYVYNQEGKTAILWIHVDDEVMETNDNQVRKTLKEELTKYLKLKWDDKLSSIVGIKASQKGNKFHLKQLGLINKLVSTSMNNFTACKPPSRETLKLNVAGQMD